MRRRRRRRGEAAIHRLTAALLGACVLGFAAPAARAERLSDERTLTRYANAVERALVYRAPVASSPVVGRLRYETEDGPLETY